MSLAVKVILLAALSSNMPSGTPFQVRVADSGELLSGHLITRKARWFHRSGSLRLEFDQKANVTVVNTPGFSTDSEGTIRRDVSKKRMLLEVSEFALMSKVVDDLTQLGIEAAVASATDASTAGVARYVALPVSAIAIAVQKGRDVKLKAGTSLVIEMEGAPKPIGATRTAPDFDANHRMVPAPFLAFTLISENRSFGRLRVRSPRRADNAAF